MSLSPFSSFLSYSYVGKLSVTLGGIVLNLLSADPKYVGSLTLFAHFVFVYPSPYLTHLSPNTNTNQPCRPIILMALPLMLSALLLPIVAAIAMIIPFVVRLWLWFCGEIVGHFSFLRGTHTFLTADHQKLTLPI